MILHTARHNAQVPGIVHLYTSLEAAAADPEHPAHEFFLRRNDLVAGAIRRDIEARQNDGSFPAEVDAAMMARVLLALSDGLQAEWEIDRSIDLPGTIEWLWNQFASRATVAADDDRAQD